MLLAQGNLGVNFGLNDDNFGSIENIKTKVDDYNLDLKNSTGFQLGVFTEIDLITFYIRPEINLIFSKSKNGTAFTSLDNNVSIINESINIDPLSIIMDMRQYLIMEESSAHPDLNNMMNNIENNGAPWPYNQQDRELWIQES